jgi:hypothetical protein
VISIRLTNVMIVDECSAVKIMKVLALYSENFVIKNKPNTKLHSAYRV